MKLIHVKFLTVFIFLAALLSIGCATNPVEFSLLLDGQNPSTIGFLTSARTGSPGVSFVSFDGRGLPRAERGTHWDPIVFPSGRELRITVHALYEEDRARVRVGGFGVLSAISDAVNIAQDISAVTRNVDTNVLFISPPLPPGGRFQLAFIKEPGIPGRNRLVLTDITTGRVFHEQEFEVTLGGFTAR